MRVTSHFLQCVNCKTDFMRCLNALYKAACLTCSFTDTQLAEYIHFKKRGIPNLPKLYAVSYVGQREDGPWVLSSSAHFSKSGQLMKVCHVEINDYVGQNLRCMVGE